jgi:site-specific recombinase XerD
MATLHVRRVKKATPSTHPILGDELRALRRLQREQQLKSSFVFTSERGAPFTTAGFARMVERAGSEAKLAFKAHPHMLRHACGYALANKGHDTRALQAYLWHRNIQHTSVTPSYRRRDLRIFSESERANRRMRRHQGALGAAAGARRD